MLDRWRRQHSEETAKNGGACTAQEKEELRRLRAQVKQLRMERDILKKAAAFFAKQSR
jgi:transposase